MKVTEEMIERGAALSTTGRKNDPKYRAKIEAILTAALPSYPKGEVKSNRAWREECQQLRTLLAAAPAATPATEELERLRDLAATCYAGLVAECNLPDEAMVERLATWFTKNATVHFHQRGMGSTAADYTAHAHAALTAALIPGALAVIVKPFDEELFNHARNDDYAAIHNTIADRVAALGDSTGTVATLVRLARHADDCLHATLLPTGEGFWHCTCGYDSIILDGRLEASPGCVVDDGRWIIEAALSKAVKADPHDVPFPLSPDEGAIWHQAQASAYQYALEMIAAPKASAPVYRIVEIATDPDPQPCRTGSCSLPFGHDYDCPQADPS